MQMRSLFVGASVIGALTFAGHAGATSIEPEALRACVTATAEASHASRVDVVRTVAHAGRGSYEYWIDAGSAPALKSYCRTRAGNVTDFRSFDGRWSSDRAARPTPVAQAVTSTAPGTTPTESCRSVDFTPPSNTGASLKND